MSLGFSALRRTTDSRRCRQRMRKTGLSAFGPRLVSMKRMRLSSPRPGIARQRNQRACLLTAPVTTQILSRGSQASQKLCARPRLARVAGGYHSSRITLEMMLLPTPTSPMLLQATLNNVPRLRCQSYLRPLLPTGDHRCTTMRLWPVNWVV